MREGKAQDGLFSMLSQPHVAEQLATAVRLAGGDFAAWTDGYEKAFAIAMRYCPLRREVYGACDGLTRPGGDSGRLSIGADGVLVPYINTAEEARQAMSCTSPDGGYHPIVIIFPQTSLNTACCWAMPDRQTTNIHCGATG